MERWLVLELPDGATKDIVLQADPETPSRTAVDAIARHVRLGSATEAWAHCERTQVWLGGDYPLSAIDLRQGDRLILSQHPPSRTGDQAPETVAPRGVELQVVGGPEAGARFPLRAGRHVIGRSPERSSIAISDPSMSGAHFELTLNAEQVNVRDLNSTNGTLIEGAQVGADTPRRLGVGQTIRAGRTLMTVAIRESVTEALVTAADGTVPFNRPPRLTALWEAPRFEVPAPPDELPRRRLPLAAALAPLALGAVMFAATGRLEMLAFSLLAPVMAAWSYWDDRRANRKESSAKTKDFQARLTSLEREMRTAAASEAAFRRRAHPDAAELINRALSHESSLWERRPADDDFMELRVGAAIKQALFTVDIQRGGNEKLRDQVAALITANKRLPAVPVTVRLRDVGTFSITGGRDASAALARWLVLQAALLHSPEELVISGLIHRRHTGDWEWLKWLPHTRSRGSPLRAGPLVSTPADATVLLQEITAVANGRDSESGQPPGRPFVLVIVDESLGVSRALLEATMLAATGREMAFLWLGKDVRNVPGSSGAIADLESRIAKLRLTEAGGRKEVDDVTADGVAVDTVLRAALRLAPLRDASAASSSGVIPQSLGLLSLPAYSNLSDENLSRWWTEGGQQTYIGVAGDGPLALDLERDGPHGLVAGTTGSGKSELLQSFVAALALAHPPSRLTFLLIDYKGGAAFKDCVALPHTVGFVTDLDHHLAHRALVSLNAELKRRESILAEAGAKDLAALRANSERVAPPSLVMLIDEFATLAKEVPEFVEGIVDVAQRGRSLGVHLVLATQRPAGVVSPSIRANTSIRIALRVSDAAESTDVIDSPAAALFPRDLPGRALLRRGHQQLTEFQAAYSGGASRVRSSARQPSVRDFRISREEASAGVEVAAGPSDLTVVVESTQRAFSSLEMTPPRRPWLPPLPDVTQYGTNDERPPHTAWLGVMDEPALQLQRPLFLDFDAQGGLLVYGTAGSGRTTLLRTLAYDIAKTASPDDVVVYGLDFGGGGLRAVAQLPHCGSVIQAEDDERVRRLLRMVQESVSKRRQALSLAGVYTFKEYLASRADPHFPRLLVVLDGYEGFAAGYERVNYGELVETLPRLIADGRAVGVHFVITAERRGSTPAALFSSVTNRIVLRMGNQDEYAYSGVDLRTVRDIRLPPGRGFYEGLAIQVGVATPDPSPQAQAQALRDVAGEARSRYPGAQAPEIGTLPTDIGLASLPRSEWPEKLFIGMADSDLAPVSLNLRGGHFLIAGPYRSGRTTALRAIATAIASTGQAVHVMSLVPRVSRSEAGSSSVLGVDEGTKVLTSLAEALDQDNPSAGPTVLLIDDAEEFFDGAAANALATILRRGRDREVRVVAAVEAKAAGRAFSGWITELRKDQHGLLLEPDADVDGALLGIRFPRDEGRRFPAGRGYLVHRGDIALVQVASPVSG